MRETNGSAKVVPLPGRKCPTCGKPAAQDFRPFCSKKCADLDLGKWLDGAYRMPTNEAPGGESFPDDDDDYRP